ncbi:hypothetical protein H2O64_15825 [Kordia sp. YSTF-M3]|uniref:DUF3828 domain-containing protein n=1 Tax=Kordia aestuariivivens TaxID=2759037 RepID=A0ABR7QC47_9FLAO|nr:hypothetical protein [Kordia aestuariivivens]MBC8756145.1 hypothetical protein [Kordia aestuariivivens]
MKKLYYIFALVITSTLFIACQNSKGVAKAEDMGKYVFDVLKKMDNTSKDDYIKTIFTFEEVKEFGENNADKISERGRKEIANLEADKYNGRMESDYNRIKEAAEKNSIVWNAIEYSDYMYEDKEEDNVKGTKGEVLFKHNDVTYSVNVSSLIVDDKYRLIRLSRLAKK